MVENRTYFMNRHQQTDGKTEAALSPALPERWQNSGVEGLYTAMELNVIHQGDWMEVLKLLPDESVHCCVTSPPYWGLRDYGVDGQLGLEPVMDEYIEKMVLGFREVRRVLKGDGTLWLNLGDSYASGGKDRSIEQAVRKSTLRGKLTTQLQSLKQINKINCGFKAKDLCGIPWRVAIALQDDGWWLRQDIIWHKPSPMPESVRDRCTKAHEYIFLLSKSQRYHYDHEAIKEPAVETNDMPVPEGWATGPGAHGKFKKRGVPKFGGNKYGESQDERHRTKSGKEYKGNGLKNKRSVWTVPSAPFKETHFATFPPKLIEPCILAGCPERGIVLDPFMGAGTTGLAAYQTNRNYIGIELNPDYIILAENRISKEKRRFALLEA